MGVFEKLVISQKVCDYFEGSYAVRSDGSLMFLYSSGEFEVIGTDFHLIPYSCGYWQSHHTDLNLATNVIISQSAIDALRFLNRNYASFSLASLLLISIGCASNFSAELKGLLMDRKVYFLFSCDILGIAAQVKLSFFLLDRHIALRVEGEVLVCKSETVELVFPIKRFSLNKLSKSLKIRNQFRILKHKICQ